MSIRTKVLVSENTIWNYSFDSLIKENDNSSISNDLKKTNQEFKNHLILYFEPIFLSTLKTQELEIDYKNPIEVLLEEFFIENEYVTKEWLNNLYITNYSDTKFLINILKIIGSLDKNLINSFGIVISGSALCHKNVEVKEMAIRVFENWNTIESYTFLKNCSLSPKWLNEYKNEVLQNIEEELCLI